MNPAQARARLLERRYGPDEERANPYHKPAGPGGGQFTSGPGGGSGAPIPTGYPACEVAIQDFARRYRRARTEHMVVLDPDGRMRKELHGDQNGVSVEPSDYHDFRGAVVVHNHPAQRWMAGKGGSFSPGDLVASTHLEVREFHAVAPEATYSLRPNTHRAFRSGDYKPWEPRVFAEVNTLKDAYHRHILKPTETAAELDGIWRRFARETGHIYEATPA